MNKTNHEWLSLTTSIPSPTTWPLRLRILARQYRSSELTRRLKLLKMPNQRTSFFHQDQGILKMFRSFRKCSISVKNIFHFSGCASDIRQLGFTSERR